ncbi:hypothetical protein LCGC14_0897880 [marine sediment metagenome]|uniref:Uncharacterized protein n=1 Tax=marine sediment metagenome TaxID=412755 RepID=A0A0F9RGE2_9ZZZZ
MPPDVLVDALAGGVERLFFVGAERAGNLRELRWLLAKPDTHPGP